MDVKRAWFLCWIVFSATSGLCLERAGYQGWLEFKQELAGYAGGPTGYYSIQDMHELNPGESVCLPPADPTENIRWSSQPVQNAVACVTYRDRKAMISGLAVPTSDLLQQQDQTIRLANDLVVRVSFLHETALKVWLYNQQLPARRRFESLAFFDYDPSGVVHGTFRRNEKPVAVSYFDSRNEEGTMYVIGTLDTRIDGRNYGLKVYSYRRSWSDIDVGLVLLRDRTSGKTTYGGGRVVDLSFPPGAPPEHMTVDLNRAYSFLCAHSSFCNCPITLVNHIDADLHYGERYPPLLSKTNGK